MWHLILTQVVLSRLNVEHVLIVVVHATVLCYGRGCYNLVFIWTLGLLDPDYCAVALNCQKWLNSFSSMNSTELFHCCPQTSADLLRQKRNKAVYTAALVADGWAGAENLEKQLCDGPTDRPTDGQIDGQKSSF